MTNFKLNRRAAIFGASSIALFVAASGASSARAQAVLKYEQLVATTISNAKTRLAAAANDNIFAANNNTIIEAVATDLRASAGLPVLKALGVLGAGVAIGLTAYTAYKYFTCKNSTVSVQSFNNIEPTGLSTVYNMVDYFNANGPFIHQGYGFTVGLGGSRSGNKPPVLDTATADTWSIFWPDNNNYYQTGDQYLFLAQTKQKILVAGSNQFGLEASFLPSASVNDSDLQSALAADTNPAPVAQVKQAVVTALTPYFPAGSPPNVDDVPDLSISPADLSLPVSSSALASFITDPGSSSSSSSSTSTSAVGDLTLPTLPQIPAPADWFTAWKSQIAPILPKIPSHTGACAPVTLQLPDEVYPQLTTKAVSFNQFCPVVDQLKPTLRTFATILGALGALIIILKA